MKKILQILILNLILVSCTNFKEDKNSSVEKEKLQLEIDSLKKLINENNSNNHQIATFLTFQKNNAENAMNFYVELFDNSEIINVKRWEKNAPVDEGKIMHATFKLNGNLFMCSDSPPIHDWDFTPAVSNYIECKNESELEKLFSKLSHDGTIMMPLNNYGFSKKFGFVQDKFGVSWQLNLQ